MFAKGRVDETNIDQVEEMAHQWLKKADAEKVIQALTFIKRSIGSIAEEHYQWAINTGEAWGHIYGVDAIDAKSLALEGLYKAAIRYEPSGSFKSYATSWIRQCVQRYNDYDILLSLDSPLKAGEDTTHIEQLAANETTVRTMWGLDPHISHFLFEDLRLKYCPHLTPQEMTAIINSRGQGYEGQIEANGG